MPILLYNKNVRGKDMQGKDTFFNRFYAAHIDRLIPYYAFFSLIGCFVINCSIYWITQEVAEDFYHYDFTTDFDAILPVRSGWIIIYLLSYAFWIWGYVVCSKANEDSHKDWFHFFAADLLGKVASGITFVVLPTTNIRPDLGSGIFDQMLLWIYSMDMPYNLFPSLHCFNSWMCFIVLRGNKNVRGTTKVFAFVGAVAICLSTQFTKQHVIVDVFSAIALAEVCYFACGQRGIVRATSNFWENINRKVFGIA